MAKESTFSTMPPGSQESPRTTGEVIFISTTDGAPIIPPNDHRIQEALDAAAPEIKDFLKET